MDRIYAWCECGHLESWHFQGGPCTRREENLFSVRNCECAVLTVESVEVFGAS